jgi:hypothetical protein
MSVFVKKALLLIASTLLPGVVAHAHHSYTRFNMASSVTLEGTIKEFQWTNPHVWIQLLVTDAATGEEKEWSIETDSPNMLARRGWSRKIMQPGDKAKVVLHPLKINATKLEGALESIHVNGVAVGVSSAVAISGGN